jgi:mannose-6-phosphate isomerase-like protein (cupin superfamily)
MGRYQYPHTIRNGTGEVITFLGVRREGAVERLEIENRVSPGAGPPMHVHYLQEEVLTVVSGRMAYQVEGEAPVFVEAGETAGFAPGVSHRFWNCGDTDLLCRGYAAPPLNLEYFLTELYASAERGKGRPNLQEIAFLATRYRSEFAMKAIPPLVQRIMFPIQLLLGRLSGRFEKYADAPDPARR